MLAPELRAKIPLVQAALVQVAAQAIQQPAQEAAPRYVGGIR